MLNKYLEKGGNSCLTSCLNIYFLNKYCIISPSSLSKAQHPRREMNISVIKGLLEFSVQKVSQIFYPTYCKKLKEKTTKQRDLYKLPPSGIPIGCKAHIHSREGKPCD